ncbi:hypothetical protein A11M_0118300 [Xanthomonas vasicola pv. vasculorum NCPPB 895]|uniref:hypothetical protein n=1 Tax=Xanthomonas vasicola TaxID=56459 RepID=UPI0004D4E72B|nr:hypothetical protein [Xanthomonas vasicola]KEZ95911.1 hypothetical protein A11M_0118300 [Xanthomonas vasicola pv. vasculorum NCPPB 895]
MAQLIRLVPQVESDQGLQLAQLFHASELSLRQTVNNSARRCMHGSCNRVEARPQRRLSASRVWSFTGASRFVNEGIAEVERTSPCAPTSP